MKNKFYSTILFFVFVVMSAQVVPQPDYGPESYPYWGTVLGTSVPMNDVKPQEWRVDGQTIQGWDWSLPSFITKPENSSFSLLKLNLGETKDENAFIALKKPTFPCSPSISIWLKWSQIEVTRGKFDFTQLTKAIDLAKAKGMHVIVRLHSAAPNFAPQWFNNLNIPTVSGGKVSYYDPKNATFHEHYLKLVAALGQSGIPNREDVTGLYVGWASGSYGDEGIGPFTGNNSSSLNSEDPIVKQRLDAWENILAPANRKKVFMGGECTYGQSKGFGVRRGFVEMYTNNIPADYIGQKLDGNGYLYVDESVPVIKDNLFNGDENEEYSTNWTIDGRFGKDRDSYNYRYFSSSIRVLQMRTNELLNYENALLPEMTAWVGTNLGRTVGNAPDIFCFLRETNILNINVKNFERWLYQRDAPGYTTVATKKIFYDGYRSTNIRNTGTEPFHDKIAREGKKIGFNIDKNWPGINGTMAFKVSVFDDNAAGTLNLKYFNGTEIVTLSKPLLGDKLLKTYTFFVSNFKIGGNIGGKFDFTLESGDATSNILVSFVRVVQAQASSLSTDKFENGAKNSVSMYPNPTSGILNVDFPEGENNREIKIFNMVGQLVHSAKTSNSSVQIDLHSLNLKGLLLVQVIIGNSVSNTKIIVE